MDKLLSIIMNTPSADTKPTVSLLDVVQSIPSASHIESVRRELKEVNDELLLTKGDGKETFSRKPALKKRRAVLQLALATLEQDQTIIDQYKP